MTELFDDLVKNDYQNTINGVLGAIEKVVGPKSPKELWNMFQCLPKTRANLSLGSSARNIGSELIDRMLGDPVSVETDVILFIIQIRTKNDIYPGARKDLGLE